MRNIGDRTEFGRQSTTRALEATSERDERGLRVEMVKQMDAGGGRGAGNMRGVEVAGQSIGIGKRA